MEKKEDTLVVRGLKKYFPGTKALDWGEDDSITFQAGKIHGLVGENGAGKSTLFQILMGIYDRNAGCMQLFGKEYDPKNIYDAENAGFSIIMQQPNFAYNLTVAENIFLGNDKQFLNSAGLIDWKKQFKAAGKILKEFGFGYINPKEILQNLPFEEAKEVEIARALSAHPKVLLVDETSAAISKSSVEKLYDLLKQQRDSGVIVIYISHYIDEVKKLCDGVSILRDGKLIKNMKITNETKEDDIIQNMIGRDLREATYRNEDQSSIGDECLRVENLSSEGSFKKINLNVHHGEIVGIAGISECGKEAFGEALFGYRKVSGGKVFLENNEINVKSPLEAMKKGIGYIPKDRDVEGLFLLYGSATNISAANLNRISRYGVINLRQEKEDALKAIKRFQIKTPKAETPVANLSGGNRQKVAIAKWVVNDSDLLIINSPTRGVDIGAKYEIYHFIEKLKNQGKAILLISDELPEIIGMSDRVYCFRKGLISGELTRRELSEEIITKGIV